MKAALQEQASKLMRAHPDPLKPCVASSDPGETLLPSQAATEPIPAPRKPTDAAGLLLVPPTPAMSKPGLPAGAGSQTGSSDGQATLAEQASSPCSQPAQKPVDPSHPGVRWHLLDMV